MDPTIRRQRPENEYDFKEGCHILELSNVPDDPQVSIARARVAPGVTTRRHRLDGIIERYVILQGRGKMTLGGRAAQAVNPGDVVIIPSGCSQQIANDGDGDLIFLAICTPRFVLEAYEDVEEDGADPGS